jgi:endoglucanase
MKNNYLLFLLWLLPVWESQAQVTLPARIEAEHFTASSNLQSGSTSDENGGQELGWLNDGSWAEYSIAVPATGVYTLKVRVANGFSDDARLIVKATDGNALGETGIPRTGGMSNFQTVSLPLTLSAGSHTIRMHVEKGVFSLNWFEFSHDAVSLPGKIEAENYVRSAQVQKEPAQDSGGGLNVSHIDDGDWMDYIVSVSESGYYTLNLRVANKYGNGYVQIRDMAGTSLGEYDGIPQTGDWQNWTTVSLQIPLQAGEQVLRLLAIRGTFNLNWLEAVSVPKQQATLQFAALPARYTNEGPFVLTATSNHSESPVVFSSANPGIVTVYNQNGQWFADPLAPGEVTLTASQSSSFGYLAAESVVQQQVVLPSLTRYPLPGRIEAENFFQSSGLQASNTSDNEGGSQHVGWIGDNQWLDYAVQVQQSGYYTFTFRVANGFSDEAAISVLKSDNTLLGTCQVPRTGGMDSWGTTRMLVYLEAGNQTLRVGIPRGVISLNWLDAYQNLKAIPGLIQAEAFDIATDVRPVSDQDIDQTPVIGYIDDNDWMDFNAMVAQAGNYIVRFRIANAYGNGLIQVKNSGGAVLGEVSVPQTGGWQSWQTIQTVVSLPAGNQIIRIHAHRGTFNFNWLEFVPQGSERIAAVIQFTDIPNQTAGGASFYLSATSNNAETPIVYSTSDSNILSLTQTTQGTEVTPVSAGTATITASQAESPNYLAAASVTKTVVVSNPPSQKITLDPNRWYILNNNSGNSMAALFDGVTQTNVNLGFGIVLNSYEAYYPLLEGESMTIEKIKMFDYEGSFESNPFLLSVITNDWTRVPVATFTGSVYNGWVGPYPDRTQPDDSKFNLDAPVGNIRYLVVKIQGGLPTELELYGTHIPVSEPPFTAGATQIKLKDMLGVNAYEWNFQDAETPWQISEPKMNMVKSFSGIRHYIDWQKLESTEGVYSYNPTLSGGWHYDQIYERCKAEGIEVLACIKTLPDWMLNTYPSDQRDHENVPLRYGMDFSNPSSYLEQAKLGFQFAARYGSNTNVDPALLSVHNTPRWPGDNPNTLKIGTGLIKYIECDNERDKWWKGRKAYQTAREYCANLSAFYDGHKNSMGPGVGVKNADPSMLVVIGGLVSGPEYIRGMIDWCKEFRGYKPNGEVDICWDVINYHIYTDNTSSSQSGTSTRGAAPEVTNAGEKADEFIRVAQRMSGGVPVWITETGFDINQGSPLKAVPIGSKSALDTQADWILRTSLFSARHGIQKVFFYQMYDDNESGLIFSTSGLINSDKTRRPAADFLYQTKKLFGEYQYMETLHQDPIVDRYQKNGESMYALMVPDEVGRTAQYTLHVGNFPKATLYQPVAGKDDMDFTEVNTVNGNVTITVTETPIFIVPGAAPNARVSSEIAEIHEPADPENLEAEEVNVYPNPLLTDYFIVETANKTGGEVEIRLFDSSRGILFKSIKIPAGKYKIKRKISVTNLPKGEYILDVKQMDKRTFKKVLYLH